MCKIAISGASNLVKTKLVKDILLTWKNYVSPSTFPVTNIGLSNGEYKDTASKTEEYISQELDNILKEIEDNSDQKYIVFDRSPIDILINTFIASELDLVSDEFTTDILLKVRDSLHLLDIIFITPLDSSRWDKINNHMYKADAIFKNLLHQYYTDFESNVFFPVKNCPGIISLESQDMDFLREITPILNKNGDLYNAEDDKKLETDFIKSISDAKKSKELLENLISVQGTLDNNKDNMPIFKI